MNPTQLATDAISALAPFLPSLLQMGESALDGISKVVFEEWGKTLANSSWEVAHKLWSEVRKSVFSKQQVAAAFKAASDPTQSDEDKNDHLDILLKTLKIQLRQELDSDPKMRSEFDKILAERRQENIAIAQGAGAVAIGGNASGNVITTNVGPKER